MKFNQTIFLHYLSHHGQACLISLKQLLKSKVTCIVTMIVMGIAWMLPFGLFVILGNIQQVAQGWKNNAPISVYLQMDTSEQRINQLIKTLQVRSTIDKVSYVSPAEGLKSFSEESGFGELVGNIKKNPLPPVLIVQPTLKGQSPKAFQSLYAMLQKLPETEAVKADMSWVERLYTITALGKRIAYVLVILLSFGVLFIVAHTIHLSMQEQRKEIEIYKLVGATERFIRRPFLYSGVWYGFFGALVAWCLVNLFVFFLHSPVQKLTLLYHSHFKLRGLSLSQTVFLFLMSIFLGLIASWVGVYREIKL